MENLIGGSPEDLVKQGSDATVVEDILEPSRSQPVVVAFGRPASGQFTKLVATLERAVGAVRGKVRLVTIDVDANPGLVGQLQVRAVPMVMVFMNGQPIDGFTGTLPDAQVEALIRGLVKLSGPSADDVLLKEAQGFLANGDFERAKVAFQGYLQLQPGHVGAIAGLARAYLNSGDAETAVQVLDMVDAKQRDDVGLASVRSAVDLARQVAHAGDLDFLTQTVRRHPDDHQARYDLALALLKAGRPADAIEALIEIIRRKRDWNEGAARKRLISIFDALGPDDPLTAEGRRRLSTILFA